MLQIVSWPERQYSQAPQALNIQGTPTAAPILKPDTPLPSATTWPVTSWPGMSGRTGPGLQSPSMAWTSLWQTPQAATRISSSPGPGSGWGSFSILSGVRSLRSTAARICWAMSGAFPLSLSRGEGRAAAVRMSNLFRIDAISAHRPCRKRSYPGRLPRYSVATRPFRVVPAQIMSSPAAGGVRPASLLAPLRNATYRRLWTATLLSNFGVWIQSVAAAWLMTSIAPTVDFVAWVQAATALPPLCFTVLGGVLADRFDQRLVFLVAQVIVLSVAAAALGPRPVFGLMTPWLLLGLTFALDSGSSLRYPAYQTTIGDLLPREQLRQRPGSEQHRLEYRPRRWGPASAASSSRLPACRRPSPSMPSATSTSSCAVPLALAEARSTSRSPGRACWPSSSPGFAHVHATATIRATMLRCFVFTCFSSALWSLLPLVAKRMAGGGASTYGLLLGALGVGALLGAGGDRLDAP